tara:strand:- start:455 stop:970 length:516 start_codon:yes stop_codon:yes gene_type:complete
MEKRTIIINKNSTHSSKIKTECQYWNFEDISFEQQHDIICNREKIDIDAIGVEIIRQIKKKISGYKRQDKEHKNLQFTIDKNNQITFDDIIHLLKTCNLSCHYCKHNVFVLFANVRFDYQWTLDRIDNSVGHTLTNCVISCLKCNLERKTIFQSSFIDSKKIINVVKNQSV